MEKELEKIEYGDHEILVYSDTDPMNPRTDWENFGHMICFHNRYQLGDAHTMDVEEIQELVERKDVVALPLYLYDHSGITMKTTPFTCPWDSGQVGFIYVTREEILKEYSRKKLDRKLIEKVKDVMRSEVKTYDQYLTGEVYGYMVQDQEGNHLDSCWGYFGYPYSYMVEEAKRAVDYIQEQPK